MPIFKQFKNFINSKYYWLIILGGGYLLRALAGLYFQNEQLPDFHSQYGPAATAFAAGLGYSGRPPGFILFLGSLVKLFGQNHYIYPAILAQSAVSLLLCYVLYKITVYIFHSETAGRLSTGVSAFYPWLVYYSTQLSLEHWFVFWVVLSVYYSIRFDQKRDFLTAIQLGLTLGFTLWIRTVFLPYILLAVCFFFLRKISWRKIAVSLLIVSTFIFSWGTYNYCVNGEWTFTGGNADHNLYIGLNFRNKTGGAIWGEDAPSFEEIEKIMSVLPPEKQKTWFKDEVKKFVRENPKQVLLLAAKKMYIFWRPYPRAPEYTNLLTIAIIFGTFVPLVLFSLYTLWIFRKDKNYLLLAYPVLYIAQLNAIHLVFAGSLVYRFPIEPLLICLASYGLSKLLPE
jgi:hypothetical protein